MCLREVCAETGDIQSTECTSLPHSLELAFQTHLLRGGCRPHPVCVCVCEGGRGEGGREVLERKGNTSNGHDHLHSNSHTWGHTSLPPHLTHTGSHLPPSSPHTHRVTPPSLLTSHTQGHTSLPPHLTHTGSHLLPLLTLPLMMTLTEPFRMIYQLPPLSPWWNTGWREKGR